MNDGPETMSEMYDASKATAPVDVGDDSLTGGLIERAPMDVKTMTANALVDTISRAASDPNVDVEKMERLLAMQERIIDRDAKVAFNVAMIQCQDEMPAITRNADNPAVRGKTYKYATLDSMNQIIKPIEAKHGLSRSFDEGDSPKGDGWKRILCHVRHVNGHIETYQRDEPCDGKGAKGGDVMTLTHAGGSADSYGRRYMTLGIYNITLEGQDDDGNAAGQKPQQHKPIDNRTPPSGHTNYINNTQAMELGMRLEKANIDVGEFVRWLTSGQESHLERIPASMYKRADSAINKRMERDSQQYAEDQDAGHQTQGPQS